MRHWFLIVLFINGIFSAQTATPELKVGDKAQGFTLNQKLGAVQGYSMPYLNRIVWVHFWSSTVQKSRINHRQLARLYDKYKSALYRNADGFEIIAIAVQSDKTAWAEALQNDSITAFINGIATRSYNDEVCKKYNVTQLPNDFLIDENGVIIAINPNLRELEYILDERKNFQVVRKNITGTIAETDNSTSFLKGGNLFLLNNYGDSITKTTVSPGGVFTINDLKLNQDFVIKIETDLNPSQNMAFSIYTAKGEKIVTTNPKIGDLTYLMPAPVINQLIEGDEDEENSGGIEQIEVIKVLQFKANGLGLLPKDEKELETIVNLMQKNKALVVELTTHLSTKTERTLANTITNNQAQSLRTFLINKGILAARIRTNYKGQTQPREKCAPCTDEQHKKNTRVEFKLTKN